MSRWTSARAFPALLRARDTRGDDISFRLLQELQWGNTDAEGGRPMGVRFRWAIDPAKHQARYGADSDAESQPRAAFDVRGGSHCNLSSHHHSDRR